MYIWTMKSLYRLLKQKFVEVIQTSKPIFLHSDSSDIKADKIVAN